MRCLPTLFLLGLLIALILPTVFMLIFGSMMFRARLRGAFVAIAHPDRALPDRQPPGSTHDRRVVRPRNRQVPEGARAQGPRDLNALGADGSPGACSVSRGQLAAGESETGIRACALAL